MTARTALRARQCDRTDCNTRIVFAVRADPRRWVPYEAEERDPASIAAAGCHVLVGMQAWTPGDLAEHFRVTFQIPTDRAQGLVAGYPHHRPHYHPTDDEEIQS